MRKIIVGQDMTLDGVVESPEKWRFNYSSPDLVAYDMAKVNTLDSMLMGRKTYEGFAAFWPTQNHNEFGIADKLNTAPKFVVSSTLKKADWNNSTMIRDNIKEEIQKLKDLPGGDIGVTGSITLVQWMLRNDLVDEIQLLVFPLVIGSGRRLFDDGVNINLQLLGSKTFSTGAILSRYRPIDEKITKGGT